MSDRTRPDASRSDVYMHAPLFVYNVRTQYENSYDNQIKPKHHYESDSSESEAWIEDFVKCVDGWEKNWVLGCVWMKLKKVEDLNEFQMARAAHRKCELQSANGRFMKFIDSSQRNVSLSSAWRFRRQAHAISSLETVEPGAKLTTRTLTGNVP